jgi:sigma54-dependent transcription regulator
VTAIDKIHQRLATYAPIGGFTVDAVTDNVSGVRYVWVQPENGRRLMLTAAEADIWLAGWLAGYEGGRKNP